MAKAIAAPQAGAAAKRAGKYNSDKAARRNARRRRTLQQRPMAQWPPRRR